MNYKKIHDKIVAKAQNRLLEGYSESHHIIPRCMGGSNDPSNLVSLTAREHFVVHQLLVKMHPEVSGLVYAARMMTVGKNGTRVNNRMYEWLRSRLKHTEETKQKLSLVAKGRKHTEEHKRNNSLARKGRKFTEEHKQKIGLAKKGRKLTEETKQKMSLAQKGEKNGMYGKKLTEETKQKLSLAHKGKKHGMHGRKHTEETKQKMSLARKRFLHG